MLAAAVRKTLRTQHYSYRTEETYLKWIRRFIHFNGKRHPRELGATEIQSFLSDLAVRGRVSGSTQNQALSTILILYKKVLQIDLPWMDDIVRAKISVDDVVEWIGIRQRVGDRRRKWRGRIPLKQIEVGPE